VDFENYNINEPWGSYKETAHPIPVWGMVKFDLEKNITRITIEM